MIIIRFLNIFVLIFLIYPLFSQEPSRSITVKYITDNIKIDGILDEPAWEEAEKATDFWQYFPSDTVLAKYQTELMLLYNNNTLYAGIRANKARGNCVVSSLRRDFGGASSDNVTMMFDTFRDGTNAFLFGVTPYGVQREVLVSGGGKDLNTTWDVKWQTESSIYDDHFIVEIAIPLSSFKFKEGEKQWRFQCYRWNLQSNEQSAWARVPQNQLFSSLAFMGNLIFEQPLGKSHSPLAFIPYFNAFSQKDFEIEESDNRLKIGADAKIAIGNAINLDVTVNPDFSNVEVDDIVTNLTRFEVLLPEKRQFFIDNSDLFGSFGSSIDANPFFSRRIGLARDSSGNLIENRIIGGVRLSGKLGHDWRLGFLNIQTAEDDDNRIASNNNMMLALQRKLFSRSNVGFFMLNRQSFEDYDFLDSKDTYNRVAGIEYNLASADNIWTGKFYVHKSFQPDDNEGNYSSQATLTYNTRKYNLTTDFVYVDKEFRSDLGFIPRSDIFKSGNSIQRSFYPAKGMINRYSFQFLSIVYWKPGLDFKKTDQDLIISWNSEFKNLATLELQYSNSYVFLFYPFDPTRTEGTLPLPGNKSYNFNQFTTQYQSNQAGVFSFNATATAGEFYNGHNYSLSGGLTFRKQPWVLLSFRMNFNGIRLPDPYPDANLLLLIPKIDITFSKSLFWATLIQYSNQNKNLGINSRIQWRFAPLSDLYLVYNDNYLTDGFEPRFRSINLKFTYWLNI
ncbi:MAG TPA: DUF5916 domain-containing protein [Bacteroidales bacterium]|nr:hydrolase [Bacteroidales bacterium]HOU96217.1 DUF5916 domain-containing protein [Bacteroidales bacterium]HQG36082.1 DUF5916 domain-containing protein [Bacteroidales bacterium]HQG52048.1 DUF5916 domain-containing protein [Bacteroidales bacterium]HQJ21336.1 DUF5916 domain-containing protein [Bacteroidales bacterium]